MKLTWLHPRILLVWWSLFHHGAGYHCPYGQNCNAYQPAPPGKAPPCAKPGFTYCVDPDPYPSEIIRKLIEAGRYDVHKLLLDESRDEFSATSRPEYPYSYGPNSLPHVDQISLTQPYDYNTKFHNRYNHDIFSQKTPLQPPSPVEPTPYNVNSYQPSNFSKFGYEYHQNTQNSNYWNPGYEKNGYPQSSPNFALYNQNFYNYDHDFEWEPSRFKLRNTNSNGVTPYNTNEWWKYVSSSPEPSPGVTVQRSVTFPTRSVRSRAARAADTLRAAFGLSAERGGRGGRGGRARRQSPETAALCPARAEYVQPRAALNNRGSWRYVVNMPDSMTQLVKVELCRSNVCSGLCSLPIGYTSKCEQKYIQKRLMALEQSGDNLYTDVFWFPSCCQCVLTQDDSG